MVFNFRKKALAPIPPLTPTPEGVNEVPIEPEYGVYQGIVDKYWDAFGNNYTSKEDMVNKLGGVDALVIDWNLRGTQPEEQEQLSEEAEQATVAPSFASKKVFNFKKAQMDIGTSPDLYRDYGIEQMEMDQDKTDILNEGPPWKDHAQLKHWLDRREGDTSLPSQLKELGLDQAKTAIEMYFSRKEEVDKGLGNKEELLDYVNTNIFPYIPSNLKEEGGEVVGNYTHVSEIEEQIKKIALKTINNNKKNAKSFNLRTAQHKTMENAILWGPDQSRIDPFLHQPVSDWHIVERNKGFGLVVDDIWNIDYETIWRENIMDKYSRPYRDKEGNWVGGYIQKRFEVDKNVPPANNMQLKPGQIRKPIIPEKGNLESRLQSARANGEIEGAIDTSKPFNWKEASLKKKV